MSLRAKVIKRKKSKIAGSYMLGETIGRGHYAVVKRAKHVILGEKVAVKIIDKSKIGGSDEVNCLKLVQHPNVVRLLEVMETPTEMMMVMELGEDGNLYDYVSRHKDGLDEETARSFFFQLTKAVEHCHTCNVVHRDIKLENIILFHNSSVLKLTDFGFSSRYVPGSKLDTSCGSLAYSAPEILIGDNYHAPAVDVWSLGVMLYMLVSGRMPFDEATESETLVSILDVQYSLLHHINPACLRLITKMLQKDPEERIKMRGVLEEEWLRGATFEGVVGEELSAVEESFVVHRMVASNIASKEHISRCLEEDPYNHISACFNLLAGRLVSKRHLREKEQAMLEREESREEEEEEEEADKRPGEALREVPESGELKNRGEVLQSKMVDGVGGVVNGGGGVGDSGGGAALRGRTKSRVAKLVLSGLEEAPENEGEEEEEEQGNGMKLHSTSKQEGGKKRMELRASVEGWDTGWKQSCHPSPLHRRSLVS